MTDPEDLNRHLPLAPHVFQILLSLAREDLHGYALLKDIDERTEGEMVLGTSTLYASLRRLMEGGFLEETEAPPGEDTLGPPRKYFRITHLGRALARAEARRVERLHATVFGTDLATALELPGNEGEKQ